MRSECLGLREQLGRLVAVSAMSKAWIKTASYEGECRREGMGVTFKWLVGVLLTLLFMGGGAWMTSLYAQVSNLQTTSVGHAERLAALESTVKSIDKHMGSMDRNVERILDQLERQASRR